MTHSALRYVAIVLLLFAIISAFTSWKGDKPFTSGSKKIYLFAMISLHIQLTIGILLYFIGPRVPAYLEAGSVMASPARVFVVEHAVGMILGIALVTRGYVRSKKLKEDARKHKAVAIMYLVGTLIILASIPWPFRGVGTNWI